MLGLASCLAPWGSGFPRPGDMGTQLDTVGVPPWNIHIFRFDTGRGSGRWVLWCMASTDPTTASLLGERVGCV